MQHTTLKALAVMILLSSIAGRAQSGGAKAATYISAEEVQTVNQQPGIDRTIRVVDIGSENFAVAIVHRGKTGAPAATGGAQAPAGDPCGEAASTAPPDSTPRGLYHESQTEGYLITSGSGTVVTGGRIVNGRKSGPDSEVTKVLNGPSCSGFIVGNDVVQKMVKVGDIIVIPAGVPHGWFDIPDHVDYLTFRPSDHILEAGYVHPSIKK
jgi:mannose-6-phosphate isomerase-like protein (cupin superfamily)